MTSRNTTVKTRLSLQQYFTKQANYCRDVKSIVGGVKVEQWYISVKL